MVTVPTVNVMTVRGGNSQAATMWVRGGVYQGESQCVLWHALLPKRIERGQLCDLTMIKSCLEGVQ
jgi:hypothetical protein